MPVLSIAPRHYAGIFSGSGNEGDKIATGPFQPTWESLQTYQVPEWFKNAKFGMWAHWGPQCQPEAGDWYARAMYEEGSRQYKFHLEKYGHPSQFGFKDVINEWKAALWNPEELVALYKTAGAKYFIAMANHHDNFDMYNSKYQNDWNATKMGPKKDIIGGWAKAAKNQGLPFGVSTHAAHAWRWFEDAQRSDKSGPLAGVPYDGNMGKADGKGKWWEGIDPQELYAQKHPLSENSLDNGAIHKQWHWGNGAIDELERKVVEEIGRWMKINSESIYDTRPWKKYGEGPSTENQAKLTGQGFNEGKTRFTALDVRFNTKGETIYATIMAWPDNGKVTIKSLGSGNPDFNKQVQKVEWLGGRQALSFSQTTDGLEVIFPEMNPEFGFAHVLKIN